MAFRCQEAAQSFWRIAGFVALVAVAVPSASAQTYTFEVRYRHWHGGAPGTLRISPQSITFQESGKNGKAHSQEWRYEQTQQLTLARDELRILTYEDSNWKLGRDREYIFDRLPRQLALEVYPLFSRNLDQRFIAALPDVRISPEWGTAAKLTEGVHGTLGILLVARDEIVFGVEKRGESRTWRMSDIGNISSTGPFDLTLTTAEKSGLFRGSMHQFHFQLQSPLTETQFDQLWHEINRRKGLRFLDPDQAASMHPGAVP